MKRSSRGAQRRINPYQSEFLALLGYSLLAIILTYPPFY